MEILLIRHGMTAGNSERRYIGSTDEPLCLKGAAQAAATAESLELLGVSCVYVSPMARCTETAGIIFPSVVPIMLDGLRECGFGVFEQKNHAELEHDPDYIRWIDGGGRLTPPGGEDSARFRGRCCEAFCRAVSGSLAENTRKIAIVTHGGVIMTLLSRFSEDIGKPRGFYDWQLKNCEGWSAVVDGAEWAERRVVRGVRRISSTGG